MSEKIWSSSPSQYQSPSDGFHALLNAVLMNNFEDVSQLLDHKVDPNAGCTESRLTVLHLAVLRSSDRIVLKLLRAGANPNVLDQDGYTPLEYATYLRRNSLIPMLALFTNTHPVQRSLTENSFFLSSLR